MTRKYVPNEKLCQLNANVNDLFGLIKPYDPAQQSHIWFVDNGSVRGFVPANVLTPYTQLYPNGNLINFEDKNNANKTTTKLSSTSTDDSNLLIDFDEQLLEEPISPPPQPQAPPPPPPPQPQVVEFCTALYNLKAVSANMIDLVKSQVYRVIEKADKNGNPDWWLVESTIVSGMKGYAPRNYAKMV